MGLGDLYDPGALPIRLKAKKSEEAAQVDGVNGTVAGNGAGLLLGGSEKPRWSARGWSKPGEASSTSDKAADGELMVEDGIKMEEGESLGKILDEPIPEGSPAPEVKTEVKVEDVKVAPIELVAPPVLAGGSLFKKRKAPVGGGNRGGRRI